MNKRTTCPAILISMFLLVPTLACAADTGISKQQRQTGEDFIKALMKNDLKAAYQLFSISVSGRYPFPIFSEIQKNVQQTIGTPVSYKLKKQKNPAAHTAAPTCIFDMVYALGDKMTAIPLELTFDPADAKGGLASFTYLKDQMKPAGK